MNATGNFVQLGIVEREDATAVQPDVERGELTQDLRQVLLGPRVVVIPGCAPEASRIPAVAPPQPHEGGAPVVLDVIAIGSLRRIGSASARPLPRRLRRQARRHEHGERDRAQSAVHGALWRDRTQGRAEECTNARMHGCRWSNAGPSIATVNHFVPLCLPAFLHLCVSAFLRSCVLALTEFLFIPRRLHLDLEERSRRHEGCHLNGGTRRLVRLFGVPRYLLYAAFIPWKSSLPSGAATM